MYCWRTVQQFAITIITTSRFITTYACLGGRPCPCIAVPFNYCPCTQQAAPQQSSHFAPRRHYNGYLSPPAPFPQHRPYVAQFPHQPYGAINAVPRGRVPYSQANSLSFVTYTEPRQTVFQQSLISSLHDKQALYSSIAQPLPIQAPLLPKLTATSSTTRSNETSPEIIVKKDNATRKASQIHIQSRVPQRIHQHSSQQIEVKPSQIDREMMPEDRDPENSAYQETKIPYQKITPATKKWIEQAKNRNVLILGRKLGESKTYLNELRAETTSRSELAKKMNLPAEFTRLTKKASYSGRFDLSKNHARRQHLDAERQYSVISQKMLMTPKVPIIHSRSIKMGSVDDSKFNNLQRNWNRPEMSPAIRDTSWSPNILKYEQLRKQPLDYKPKLRPYNRYENSSSDFRPTIFRGTILTPIPSAYSAVLGTNRQAMNVQEICDKRINNKSDQISEELRKNICQKQQAVMKQIGRNQISSQSGRSLTANEHDQTKKSDFWEKYCRNLDDHTRKQFQMNETLQNSSIQINKLHDGDVKMVRMSSGVNEWSENDTQNFKTYYHQKCTGRVLGRSRNETIATAARKCDELHCDAANIRLLGQGFLEVAFLEDTAGRFKDFGSHCVSRNPVDEITFADKILSINKLSARDDWLLRNPPPPSPLPRRVVLQNNRWKPTWRNRPSIPISSNSTRRLL
ncbi:unnamed protein product [Thelazia callipaeda]|uniref:ZM domain-containing protein n=1 Tax=Thelazia callipaeda TaxID=103827 RepID=A0A158RC79_THECL|nr:unnamed protein product [Thelazia callipaeda]